VSYIEGCESQICIVLVTFDIKNDKLDITLTDDPKESARFIAQISLPKLFRNMEREGINDETFDEDLYAIRYKHLIIEKAIINYLRKNLQIVEYDQDM